MGLEPTTACLGKMSAPICQRLLVLSVAGFGRKTTLGAMANTCLSRLWRGRWRTDGGRRFGLRGVSCRTSAWYTRYSHGGAE